MEKRISGIVRAGGCSSRMGRNKAELDFHGVSLLRHQVNRLRTLGIEDLIVAGYPDVPDGCRHVPDIYPHRGPLSGIHAGLLAAKEAQALVLAVDTPLVPLSLLEELILRHRAGITVVSCSGELEPLIGVYDRKLAGKCEKLLQKENASPRKLFQAVGVSSLEYAGDPGLLMNCNTPGDYDHMIVSERQK